MTSLLAAIKICRPVNLAIIILAQITMRFFVLEPLFSLYELQVQVPEISFWLFVIATVCIAAGGYVINDFFDYKIDMINKPNKVYVREILSEKWVNNQFIFLYVIGFSAALLGSYKTGKIEFTFIFGAMAILLYYYASELKSKLIVSNLIVAFLLGMVTFSIGIIEITMINVGYSEEVLKHKDIIPYFQSAVNNALGWVSYFSIFAFLLNIPREIVKDIIDIEGDECYRVQTIPSAFGIKKAQFIAGFFYLTCAALLIYIQQWYLYDVYSSIYFFGLAFLLISLAIFSVLAKSKKQFELLSNGNKILLIIGISYGFLAAYLMKNIV